MHSPLLIYDFTDVASALPMLLLQRKGPLATVVGFLTTPFNLHIQS